MLPPPTQRLFAHYSLAEVGAAAARDFVALRLAEEGDREDLAWLLGELGERRLAELVLRRGSRALSHRSRAFWRRVLDLPALHREPAAEEIWPL